MKWDLLHGFGAYRLPQIVATVPRHGPAADREFIDADTALRIGLISRLVEPEALMLTADGSPGPSRPTGRWRCG